MILLSKIISVLIGLIVLSKSYADFKKKQESLTMFLFWFFVWILIIVFAIFPILIERINHWFGNNGSGVNTFIGITFVLLFFIIYRVYVKAHRLEKRMDKLVSNLSLKDIKRW